LSQPLLRVSDLKTQFGRAGGPVIRAVDGVSFELEAGETLGLVGESGSGKTTTAHSIVRMLPPGAAIAGGSIRFDGEELTALDAEAMRAVRGGKIGMILQDPMASLDPLFTILDQVAEPARYHRGLRGKALREEVRDLLSAVRIPSPEKRMHDYPHQMSGGQRQRVVGASALAGKPKLIIADEPTTSLDVTVQRQYLDLLKRLQRDTGVAMIFITHDLGIVAKICDKVAVMYAGRIVEQRGVRELFDDPRHPYTRALLDSMPKLGSNEPLYGIPGAPPNLTALPAGCHFNPRCPRAFDPCRVNAPPEIALAGGQSVRCHLYAEGAENV
jgi:oligopeptide/dipeptide ABC transporter ATP-binding protein